MTQTLERSSEKTYLAWSEETNPAAPKNNAEFVNNVPNCTEAISRFVDLKHRHPEDTFDPHEDLSILIDMSRHFSDTMSEQERADLARLAIASGNDVINRTFGDKPLDLPSVQSAYDIVNAIALAEHEVPNEAIKPLIKGLTDTADYVESKKDKHVLTPLYNALDEFTQPENTTPLIELVRICDARALNANARALELHAKEGKIPTDVYVLSDQPPLTSGEQVLRASGIDKNTIAA